MPQWQLGVAMATAAVACIGTAVVCRDRFSHSAVRQMLAASLFHSALWCVTSIAMTWGMDAGTEQVIRGVGLLAAAWAAGSLWCLARVVTEPTWRPSRITLVSGLVLGAGVLVAARQVGGSLPVGALPWEAAGGLARSLASISWERLLVAGTMLAAVGRLFSMRRHLPTPARGPLRTISLAITLAAAASAATIPDPDLLGGVDYAPLACALAALVSADVLMRRHYLRIAPPSAEQVLESLTDAVVVLGPEGRILSLNAAARQLVTGPAARLPAELLLGWSAEEILHPALVGALTAPRGFRASLALATGVHFDARAHVLTDGSGDRMGVVVVAREISELAAQHVRAELAYAGLEHERERVESVVTRLLNELSEIEQQRMQLAEDSVRDALTGVHNRRLLEPAIGAAIQGSRATGRPFAVLMVDVDHFKNVNDTHGHPVGDRVLQALARELTIATRRGESVLRYGGEEFVVVIPDVGPFDAVRRAEEIRLAAVALRVPLRSGEHLGDLGITVSVGLSTYPVHGETPRELVAAADGALFAAKAGGRNCVVSA